MLTILFGARASRDFFKLALTTQYLTDAVKDPNNWAVVIKRHKEIKGSSIVIVDSTEVIDLINLILGVNPKYHFEQIAEVLDKLCSYWYDPNPMFRKSTALGRIGFSNARCQHANNKRQICV